MCIFCFAWFFEDTHSKVSDDRRTFKHDTPKMGVMLWVWCWLHHRGTSHAYYLCSGVFTSQKKIFCSPSVPWSVWERKPTVCLCVCLFLSQLSCEFADCILSFTRMQECRELGSIINHCPRLKTRVQDSRQLCPCLQISNININIKEASDNLE